MKQTVYSGEASPAFGHANENFYVFIDRVDRVFPCKESTSKEINHDKDLNCHDSFKPEKLVSKANCCFRSFVSETFLSA